MLIQDKKTLQKINKLLKSITRDGALEGEGKPEKLKHKDGEYSRRIYKENRLVYEFSEDKITVKHAAVITKIRKFYLFTLSLCYSRKNG